MINDIKNRVIVENGETFELISVSDIEHIRHVIKRGETANKLLGECIRFIAKIGILGGASPKYKKKISEFIKKINETMRNDET